MNVRVLLERQKKNERIAIKFGKDSITYEDWNRRSIELASIIKSISSEFVHNISIYLPNTIDYAIAYFGVLFSDRVIVPIGIQAKELELFSTLTYCEVDIIITSILNGKQLIEMLGRYQHRCYVIYIENGEIIEINGDKDFVNKSERPSTEVTPEDTAIMLHTSGTTSNPKRVMLTHSNLINNVESNISSLGLTQEDKVLIALPMYFGYCNTAQFLTHTYLGASMVIMEGMFLPKMFFGLVQSEKITNFTGVPSMLLMIMEYRYFYDYDISSLRYICFGGGNFSPEKIKQLISRFDNVGFVQTYGQTEASPRVTALLPEYSLVKCGSVGRPIPNVKIKVVDNEGNSVKPREIGEIVVSGKNVMKGYYKQELITKDTIKDGWLYTGDYGFLDDENFLYLAGRKKNMIISGGINIYPEEIEEILQQHEYVKEVCVLAEEHKLLGEVPIAKIVLKDGQHPPSDLREYCVARLARYKVPIRFDYIEKLERTYNGKIKRY